ncbi:MAG: HK97 family phage prohead protease [Clostridia bacterium]|nr:HK97 family phage prohead protease [Clostridia bacterium]
MKDKFISRNYDFEIRAEKDEKRGNIIVGRPIVYDSKTDIGGYFEEVIERGALKNANLEDVRFLVNHDQSKIPLARSRKNTKNSTMKLTVDNDGLEIQVELDTENNTEARNLYSAIERGDITGMSFFFGIEDEEWENLDSDYPTRHIKAISTVVEVSAVTFPAYQDTSIAARDKSAVDTARLAVDTARSEAVDTTSEELEREKLKIKYLIGGI